MTAVEIIAIRDDLIPILATEAANPKPSYSVYNRSVDYNGWRQGILAQIDQLTALANSLDPFIIQTRQEV